MIAFLVLDMQNDFLADDGAYAESGMDVSAGTRLLPALKRAMNAARAAEAPILASRFTVLTDRDSEPINLGHVAELRPFLLDEGFRRDTEGHDLHPDLPEPDFIFDKYRFSPFYLTPLEIALLHYGVDHLVLAGIATNGAVEACARDAVMRDYEVTVLTDLCASFSQENHDASLVNLRSMATLTTSNAFDWNEDEGDANQASDDSDE